MRNTVRVLSTAELKSALESARKSYHIETDYFSGDDTKIVERIACAQPDVVILNLFMPEHDAVEVIKAYKALYSDSFTYFAVFCPFLTTGIKRELSACGVNRVLCSSDYRRELHSLLDEASNTKAASLASVKSAGIHAVHRLHHRSRISSPEDMNMLGRAIDDVLNALGMNQYETGCRYLRLAVMLAASENGENFQVTKSIYPSVAAEFGTTPSSVERRIRCAISDAWRRSDSSALLAGYFGYTVDNLRGKPSNSEFIAMLADRIQLDIYRTSDIGSVRKMS
ncbi:MAG: hypothetical protein IJM51_08050 [Clostridia bacterium]|nr:hypothetical protein [Clostridia bacterium]